VSTGSGVVPEDVELAFLGGEAGCCCLDGDEVVQVKVQEFDLPWCCRDWG